VENHKQISLDITDILSFYENFFASDL